MPQIYIDKQQFIGGMSPSDRLGRKAQYSGDSVGIDVFRNLGGITPGMLPVEKQGAVVTDLIRSFIEGAGTASDDSNNVYAVSGGSIYRILKSDGTPTQVLAITSGSIKMQNNLEQYAQSGVNYLFSATNTDIIRSGADWSSGAGYAQTYWTVTLSQAALTSSHPHPLKRFLTNIYVADGNAVHEINGVVVTLNKLTLPPNQEIIQMEERLGELVILARIVQNGVQIGNTRLYFWDGIAAAPSRVVPINESNCSAMLNCGGVLYLLIGTTKFYLGYYDGTGISRIATLPADGLPGPGGFAAKDGGLYILAKRSSKFAIGGMVVLTYDSPYPEIPPAITSPFAFTVTNATGFQIGALFPVSSTNVLCSHYSGSTSAYKLFSASGKYLTPATFLSDIINGGEICKKNFDHWKFYFTALAAGEAIQFAYSIDGGAFVNFTNGNPNFATHGALNFWQIEEGIHAHEIQIRITITAGTSNLTAPTFFTGVADFTKIRE